jgi:hypothetical protein
MCACNNAGTVGTGCFLCRPRQGYIRSWLCAVSSPHEGGFKYLHCSPVSCRWWRKGNPVPGGITGAPCSWGVFSVWSTPRLQKESIVCYELVQLEVSQFGSESSRELTAEAGSQSSLGARSWRKYLSVTVTGWHEMVNTLQGCEPWRRGTSANGSHNKQHEWGH